MPTMTTSTMSNAVKTLYSKYVLALLIENFVFANWADLEKSREISKDGRAKSIEFRKYPRLAAAAALTEGVTPAGNNLTVSTVTATPAQYGDYLTHTDILLTTIVDDLPTIELEMLSDQAETTLNQNCRDPLNAGTSVQYAGGVAGRANIAAANKMSVVELKKGVRTLEKNNVKRFPDEFGGSYILLISHDTSFDFRSDPEWKSANEYAGSTNIFSGEIGRLYGVRIIATSASKVFPGAGAGGIDVHTSLLFGQHWYATPSWGMKPSKRKLPFKASPVLGFEVIAKDLGEGGDDPLNQRGTLGWKTDFICLIIDQQCGLRIEHSVSA